MTVGSYSTANLLVRPRLYDDANQLRSEYQQVRFAILTENFDREMVDFIVDTAGEDTSQLWGIPDTALNPLASGTRQLTTPGLYGTRPGTMSPNGAGEALAGTGGLMDDARYWSRSQWVQYLAVGLGLVFRRLGAITEGPPDARTVRLTDRIVLPQNVVAWATVDEPTRVLGLWELRVRTRTVTNGRTECFYAWDQWEINPNTGQGSLHVMRCGYDGQPMKGEGSDVSASFLVGTDGQPGPLVGERYPYRRPDGSAYLPWVTYRAVDTGEVWPTWRRGMHRGTLRACALWTYTARTALHATGEHTILAGPDTDALPTTVRRGDNDQNQSAHALLSMQVTPGMITVLPMADGKTLQSVQIGPGVNLPNLSAYAQMYQMLLFIGDGQHPSDASRQSANPSSGIALEINASSRREFSAQVQPLFRESDTEAIAVYAWLLTSVGQDTPADGYSLTYHVIPLTPTEQGDLRAQLQWEEERGQISPIDSHLRLYPGRTPEQAEDAIVQARVDAARINKRVADELIALGVVAPKTDEALAGAQSSAMLSVITAVGRGEVSVESAQAQLERAFGLATEVAAAMLVGMAELRAAKVNTAAAIAGAGGFGGAPPADDESDDDDDDEPDGDPAAEPDDADDE